MEKITHARRGQSIDQVITGFSPAPVEKITIPKVENGLIGHVFGLYLAYLQDENCYAHGKVKFGLEDEIYERVKPVDSAHFTALLETMKTCADFEHHESLFHHFVDALIQKSYDLGNNDFIINGSQIPGDGYRLILRDLKGKIERPLHVTIRTRNSHLVFGYRSEMGSGIEHRQPGTEHCIFEIHGNLIDCNENLPYADGAKACTFVHYGRIQLHEENISDYEAPEECVFKTNNRKTLGVLKRKVGHGNRIYFIGENRKEELVRD